MRQASCNGLRSGWLEARKLLSRCFQRKTQPITAALRSAYRSGSNHHAEGNATELQTVRWKKDEGWADLADKLRELPTRVTLIWKKRPKNISLLMSFCHVYVMCNVIDSKALNRPLNPLWRGEALQGAGRVDAYSRSHGTFL